MNRLLNRTLFYYTIFATIILLLSSPVFYFMMEKLYIDDVDEAIMLRKKEFLIKSRRCLRAEDINIWNRFNRDISILPDTITSRPKDRIIQEIFYDEMMPEWEPYRVLYTDVMIQQKRYVLMIRLNLVESQDLIITLTWLYFFVLFSLLIVIFFVSRFISNRIWKPFHNTLNKIRQFNIEQHTRPVFTDTSIVEFTQLNKVLGELIKNNLKAYQNQKEFTENAAHELQTPLAVFHSKLDMMLQDPSLNNNQAIILQSLYEAASRLSRVNKNLLLLAKIENNQFTFLEEVDTGKLIDEVLPYFTEQALSRELVIECDINNAPVLNASKQLMEILINNLMLNAISHNRMRGTISIKASGKEITICNTSDQPQLSEESLFKRFGRISRASHSSGLGLAIIKQICQLHGWQVSYQYHLDRHCFSIIF